MASAWLGVACTRPHTNHLHVARPPGLPCSAYPLLLHAENCIVIAEGALGHDGVLHVRALGFPPTELRSALPLAAQRLNLFGGADVNGEALLALQQEEQQRTAEQASAQRGRGGGLGPAVCCALCCGGPPPLACTAQQVLAGAGAHRQQRGRHDTCDMCRYLWGWRVQR